MAGYPDEVPVLRSDSATKFERDPRGAVAVTASHGGKYPAMLVAALGVKAAVFNDAGVGKDGAGIAGLAYLEEYGIAAATVGNRSSRIGDGEDTMRRGVISHANALASALGCVPGLPCADAALLLRAARPGRPSPPPPAESRQILFEHGIELVCIDSNSLVLPEDARRIVITGSHGGLLGGRKETALKYDALGAVYNDAGVGVDGAGCSRLPALDERGIAAATVASGSARIGEAMSTYREGVISAVNETAAQAGVAVGMPVSEFVIRVRMRSRRPERCLSPEQGKNRL